MRTRKQPKGDKNIIGTRIEEKRLKIGMHQKELLAQLQVSGIDMNASAISKIEGQIRSVADFELLAISKILNVSVYWLLTGEEEQK
ncbi:MAG: helix-turn-helix transcriptional regulator [Clostridia bacterium]